MYLMDLDINESFVIEDSDIEGVLTDKSELSCLVILNNNPSFDNDGNPVKIKQKLRIASQTKVRRIDVNS